MSLRDLMLRSFFQGETVEVLDVALLLRDREVKADGYTRIPARLRDWRLSASTAQFDAAWAGFRESVSFDAVALMRGSVVEHLFPRGPNTVAAGNPITAQLHVDLDEVT